MKLWNQFFRAVFASLLLSLFTTASFGQLSSVSRYTVTTETGTWVDATSGTALGGSDDNIWRFNSPFAIIYDSTTIPSGTTFSVTDDGNFVFKNISSNPYSSKWIGGAAYPGTIGVVNEDLIHYNGTQNYWTVTGSAPNRVLVVEWYRDSPYAYSNEVTSLELQIHETSGVIELLYADHSYSYQSVEGPAYIGLNGMTNSGSNYNQYGTSFSSTPSTDLKFTPANNRPKGEFSLLPKSLNFGSLLGGQMDTLCVTASNVGVSGIGNNGAPAIHITGYSIQGSSAFTVISGPPVGDSITPGNSVQYCIQFLPLSGGTLTGTFYLSTDAPDSGTQSVSLTGFGKVPEVSYGATQLFRRVAVKLGDTSSEQYIPVTSTGGAPLTFNSISFIGLNSNNYFVSRMPQNPLPPDVTDSIGIRFTPTIEGRPDAAVVISTNAVNIPLDTVQLFGVGTLPHLVIMVAPPGSGNTVMFDSVAIGDSVCQMLTLINTGTDTLAIPKQLVTYGDYDFTYYPLTGRDTVLLPGDTQYANVCFKPLKAGTRVATIRFYTNIPPTFEKPARDTSQFAINLTGIGVPFGQLAVMGSLTDTAIVGKTNCLTDTLINRGQSDITVTAAKLTGPEDSAFALPAGLLPFSLGPGQTKIISLCFSPTMRGTQVDTLTFTGTTSEKAITQPVFLQGVGLIECVAGDSMITFGTKGMTLVSSVDTSCITVTNCGDLAATYTASLPAGTSYTLVPPLTTALIPAGGTAQFCVTFAPTEIGAANASVTITGGPAPALTRLGGVGAGVVASATGAPTSAVPIDTCSTFNITITNTGNVSWTPGTGTIGGTNAADFTIVSGPTPAVIPPNGTATVTISFCPKTQGSETMTLTFPNENPVPVAGAFSYSTTGVGAASGFTIKTEQDGFMLGASYPNPTNGSATIELTLPNEAFVRIDLLDAKGVIVRNAFSGQLGAGLQALPIDMKGLNSGTYFYMLTSGDVRLTRQLSLIK